MSREWVRMLTEAVGHSNDNQGAFPGVKHNVEVKTSPTAVGLLVQKRTAEHHPVDRVSGILRESFDIDAHIEEIRGESSPLPKRTRSIVDG